MFVTDDKYYDSIFGSPVVRSTISGEIVINEATVIPLTDRDIVPGSLSVDNKCVNGDSFQYGAVFQGELNVTIMKEVDRYSLYDKKITFTVHQIHSDGSVQDVPIGEFFITDPQRSKKLITIKAADVMANFDVDIEDSFFGTIFEAVSTACDKCGVIMQQSEADLKTLANGGVTVTVNNGQVKTYRDMLCYLGGITCSFATINRFGKLELRPYGKEVVRTVPISRRKDTVVSDYQTYYKGVKIVFSQNDAKEELAHIDESSDGLVMDLGEVPIIFGVTETKQKVVDNIFAELEASRYTPASFNLLVSDPTLELGDRISLGGMPDMEIETFITSFTWKYHDSMSVKGVGGNPKLVALKKKDEVELNELANSIAAKNMIVYTYTNAGKLVFSGDVQKEIISISYTAIADAVPIFIATIPVEMSIDGYLVLTYKKNDAPVEGSTIRKYLEKGSHFVTCMYHTSDKTNTWNMLSVVASTEYAENSVSAEIEALKTFATSGYYPTVAASQSAPTATIGQQQIKAVLFGQGLASDTKAWDGRLSFIETVPAMKVGLQLRNIIDSLQTEQIMPVQDTIAETVPMFKLGLTLGSFTDMLEIGEVTAKYTVESAKVENYEYDSRYVGINNGIFALNHDYVYADVTTPQADRGNMCELEIDLMSFASVESVVVKYD